MFFDWLSDLRQQLSSFHFERRRFSERRKVNRSIRVAETLEARVLLSAAAVELLDLGDAPDGYPVTLADNGARHLEAFAQTGSPSLRLGTVWDAELDGTHSPQSDFDDLNPATAADDEDGVTFGVLNPGDAAAVTKVIVNGAPNGARLDAWMDFNQNSIWESTEQIFANEGVSNGVNNLTFSIPAGALPGTTYTRYRLSFGGGLAPDGAASSGEVEDYEVKIETPPASDWDFGDAPDGYPVTLADDGARHAFAVGPIGSVGLRLGSNWDSETDGTHSVNSTFDDLNPVASPDDEDGVTFGALNAGDPAAATDVTVNGAPLNGALLDAWMDFNQDNDWDDPGEQIFSNQVVINGVNNLTFVIPAGALSGTTYTRYRLSAGGGLAPDGASSTGEVEDYEVRIETPPANDWDFGDAPDGYPVMLADDGARHIQTIDPTGAPGLRLGTEWDSESDGTHSPQSDFDDLNPGAPDDEDGVTFGVLNPGDPAAVTDVKVSGAPVNGAFLDAWMDFNQNNVWEPSEQIFTSQAVNNGVNNLPFSIPAGALTGTTYTRYRLSFGGGLAADGAASNGEVEDYEVKIETPPANDWDFGDAPDGYPVTLADDGARHIQTIDPTGAPGLRLGTEWDSESDGTHSPQSDFDDLNPGAPDDEDGVTFGVLNPGAAAAVTDVFVTGAPANGALLDAWMDFNQDNDWGDPGEQIFTSQVVNNGVNNLTFSIPAGALTGTTYTRYRLSFGGGLAADGAASSGEVEDYEVKIETPPASDWDFGDAPDGYPVMLSDNGARHAFAAGPVGAPGLRLGTEWDSESDGTHSPQSDFDDLNPGAPDDEDGVSFGVLNPGDPAAVTDVKVSGAPVNGAFLDAWMDFNQNNVWEPSEQIFTNEVVLNGINNLTFSIPAGALPGTTYTRYRLSASGGLAADGAASSGEVEDYEVKIETPPASDWDFGDAPDGYPVTLADDGARHVGGGTVAGASLRLGTEWDSESDGTHSPQSDFDDLNPGAPDDEDGVTFGVLNPGDPAAVTDVTVSGAPANGALLDAWMDFNQNNAWEPSEQIFTSKVVINGVNNLAFSIPAGALTGTTYTRYRLSFGGGLAPDGAASSGEVEDYEVTIQTPPANDWDFGDAPFGYPVTLADDGARHVGGGTVAGAGLRLGSEWDSESDGTHSPQSDFDDLNPGASPDDEDGVTFGLLFDGDPAAMTDVTVSGAPANGAFLDAWIDFNQDNDWDDPGEQIFTSQIVVNGVNNLTFAVPSAVTTSWGKTYARYRLSEGGGLTPKGGASTGEVEDYEVRIDKSVADQHDFGDAPDGYPVMLSENGAWHALGSSPYLRLGNRWDSESDGTHSPQSDFDDLNPGASPDDEDGVTFGVLNPGDPVAVTDVTVSGAPANGALLDAWMDFNQNKVWEPSEQIFTNEVVVNGVNNLTFAIPAGALTGTTYTRYRLSPGGGLTPEGAASSGEVEDYEVTIQTPPANDWDFGDAPDGYPVMLSDNGARHAFAAGPVGGPGLRLGNEWDSESDGTHSPQSDFDDLNPGAPDDEDGVTFGVLNPGDPAAVTDVTVSGAPVNGAFLDAWMDFNQNNVWEPSEQIFTNKVVVNGVNNLTFSIPAGALPGTTYTRYRLSASGGLAADGSASSGEVEDYEVKIETPPANDWDFGDAPDGYPVMLSDNGARHAFAAGPAGDPLRLGKEWDAESDGTHSPQSDFDDLNPGAAPDDEDGVTFGPLYRGAAAAKTKVVVSGAPPNGAFLDAWMDFNQNNVWEPSEQIFTSQLVNNGVNSLTFSIPGTASTGITYTRYRLSASGGLTPDGAASTGEVEDYQVKIKKPLVAYWDFEVDALDKAPGGSVADDGTLVGAAIVDGGLGTGALEFSGGGEVMKLESSADLNQGSIAEKSIALWFQPSSVKRRQVLYQQGGNNRGLNIYLENGSIYAGGWNAAVGWDGTWLSSANITQNAWNHVTFTYNAAAGEVQLYVNGAAPLVGAASAITSHGRATLGSAKEGTRYKVGESFENSSLRNSYTGLVDDVRVYEQTLSAAAAAELSVNAPADQQLDLVAHWDFEENTLDKATGGTVADDGTLVGSALVGGGLGSSALEFSGGGEVMKLESSADINQGNTREKSISLWFQPSSVNGRQVLYQQGGNNRGLNLYIENGSIYAGGWNAAVGWDGTWLSSAKITQNAWNHVTFTYNAVAGEVQLYVNGDAPLVGTASTITSHGRATLGSAREGSRYKDGAGFENTSLRHSYTGLVDDVRVHDRALTDAEAAALSANAPADQQSDLVAYWDFEGDTLDNATGGTVADDGTLTGAAFVGGGLGTSALEFSGGGDVMTLESSADINQGNTTEKSISLWFQPDSLNGRQVLYQQGGNNRGLNIYIENGSIYAGGWNAGVGWDGTWLSSANIAENTWNHVTFTYNAVAGEVQLYVNGDAPLVGAASSISSHGRATLGSAREGSRYKDGAGFVTSSLRNSYSGLVDDVRVHDRALTDEEAALLASVSPL